MLVRPNVVMRANAKKKQPDELSLKQMAKRMKITPEAARRLCHRGTVPHVRRGGRIFVRVFDVKRLLADRVWRKLHSRRDVRAGGS